MFVYFAWSVLSVACGEAWPLWASHCHFDGDVDASLGTESMSALGVDAVAAGEIGLGKLMSVVSSACSVDLIVGCTMSDGADSCDSLFVDSVWRTGAAS